MIAKMGFPRFCTTPYKCYH